MTTDQPKQLPAPEGQSPRVGRRRPCCWQGVLQERHSLGQLELAAGLLARAAAQHHVWCLPPQLLPRIFTRLLSRASQLYEEGVCSSLSVLIIPPPLLPPPSQTLIN